MQTGKCRRAARCERGFTYVTVLFFLAVLGIGLAATAASWQTAAQRQRERELIFIGAQFQQAIALYYQRSPGEAKEYPRRLVDLLQDSRYPTMERYLRRIYTDPMTGKREWGLVDAPEGGIMGVYSLSREKPMRTLGLDATEGAPTYRDWKFIVRP
jgi:type II secretory pathway pseudopilin PulG